MASPFQINPPTKGLVPLLISVPHCGTDIPQDIIEKYDDKKIKLIADTDFFVDRLYKFATELGITIIKAHYSRWVIDLNRSPQNQNLYKDGRIITSLTPTTDFNGDNIYNSKDAEPDPSEVLRRIENYYRPYHDKVAQILNGFKEQFGIALLWDAHSIKRNVPLIYDQPFPDLVLGSNDQKSASAVFINQALHSLAAGGHSLEHNHPFKGGHITRIFGRPENNIHALQLEMSKDCYMDDSEISYDEVRASKVQETLKDTLTSIIDKLQSK